MQIMRRQDKTIQTRVVDGTEEHLVLVETDQDEIIDLVGATEAEVQAKLHDFLVWAS